jgi:hypothetical protein
VKFLLALSFLMMGCAGLGTEPQALNETGTAAAGDAVKPGFFKAPGDHTPEEIYAKLQTIAGDSAKAQPFPKTGTEFNLELPSEKPQADQSKEWIWSHVQVFYKDHKIVDQITLITQNCNVKLADLDQAALGRRTQSLVVLVSKTLFGMPFQLSDKYFAESGDWKGQMRIPIRQEYLPVVDMRMIRGSYKCDGRGGYGYRYDFFMK